MATKLSITPMEWQLILELVNTGRVDVARDLIYKVRAGKQDCSERLAIAIHKATDGSIPCWKLRPKTWQPGDLPPCLTDSNLNGAA